MGHTASNMWELLQNAGIFAWPLLLCSILSIFIIIERSIALRQNRIVPEDIQEKFIHGEIPEEADTQSVAGRILWFYRHNEWDAEQLKAFARFQVNRMERGLFILEIVVSAAPLLGLLGTVTGLVKVFGQISPTTGLPDSAAFVGGVAMALSTTMIGLAIAIPSLAFSSYLNRRIDNYNAQISVGVERLVAMKSKSLRR
jgi:biopolymer transport protein ExbB